MAITAQDRSKRRQVVLRIALICIGLFQVVLSIVAMQTSEPTQLSSVLLWLQLATGLAIAVIATVSLAVGRRERRRATAEPANDVAGTP